MKPAELVREYLEAFPDVDRVAGYLAEDVRFHLYSPMTSERQGRERIRRGLAKEFRTFYRAESFKLSVLHVFGDDEFAFARFQIEAETHFGPYRNDYAMIARVVDGKIVQGWEFTDTAGAAAQLGDAMAEHQGSQEQK